MSKRAKIPAVAYPVVIEYSAEDRGYVARVPALKYCTAFGATYEEAAREIQSAMEGWLETAQAHGTSIPPPVTHDELLAASELLNLTELSRRAGLPPQTLFAKLRRGTALKPAEAKAITRTLRKAGLQLTTQPL